ncbi:MAG: hypothetical protein GY816_14075, partial [Cytophagales bacterium]|nr:hypothetical protein [Cytophagales bacterium]
MSAYKCAYCNEEFTNKWNKKRHVECFHSKEASDDDSDVEEEDGDSEEEVEDGPWSRLLHVIYANITKDWDDELTAEDVLESKPMIKEILAELRHEVEYITNIAGALEDDELYLNLVKSKEKLEEDENYTPEEANIMAWKNRRLSLQKVLENNINVLHEVLG